MPQNKSYSNSEMREIAEYNNIYSSTISTSVELNTEAQEILEIKF